MANARQGGSQKKAAPRATPPKRGGGPAGTPSQQRAALKSITAAAKSSGTKMSGGYGTSMRRPSMNNPAAPKNTPFGAGSYRVSRYSNSNRDYVPVKTSRGAVNKAAMRQNVAGEALSVPVSMRRTAAQQLYNVTNPYSSTPRRSRAKRKGR